MAYGLFSRDYDITLRNSFVTITDKWTGQPALILETPNGGVKSAIGVTKLNDSARLEAYIDLSKTWNVKVLDGQVLEYNVNNPKKIVSITDLQQVTPEIGVTYVLDQEPYTEYTWDGTSLVSGLTSSEVNLVKSMASGSVYNVTFNTEGNISGYIKGGVQHTVEYPNSGTIVFSNDTGEIRTVTLTDGKVTGIF